MGKVKIVLNRSGVRGLLKSSEAGDMCMEFAHQVQGRAGEHYNAEIRRYPERTGAAIYPADSDGYYDNLKNNTLLRALK